MDDRMAACVLAEFEADAAALLGCPRFWQRRVVGNLLCRVPSEQDVRDILDGAQLIVSRREHP